NECGPHCHDERCCWGPSHAPYAIARPREIRRLTHNALRFALRSRLTLFVQCKRVKGHFLAPNVAALVACDTARTVAALDNETAFTALLYGGRLASAPEPSTLV